jgi:HPr kinase/phosphorylase
MDRGPTLANFFDRLGDALGLEAVVLDRQRAPLLPEANAAADPPTLIGHLNLIQANRIQVLGHTELDFWSAQDETARTDLIERLFEDRLCGLIVTDGLAAPVPIVERARATGVPLLSATVGSERVIRTLRQAFSLDLVARTVQHGVFMDVLGVGVLVSGASGAGKSEMALELVSRGHSLVADDAPELHRPMPDTIEGRAPYILRDFLEVGGLGVINIRRMYGDAAIREHKRLQLIIHLEPLTGALRQQLDRLNGNLSTTEILGVKIDTMTLPVAPGRNLAVLTEAAVRNFLLVQRGYDAASDLMARQQQAMEGGGECD